MSNGPAAAKSKRESASEPSTRVVMAKLLRLAFTTVALPLNPNGVASPAPAAGLRLRFRKPSGRNGGYDG